MKKTLALLLALIVAISVGTVTLAECSHENATVIGSQEPDCFYEGFKFYLCSDCGTTWREKLLPTGEHTYKTVEELAPTCVEAGYVWQECAVCGAEKNFESGEPTGEHTYKTVKELAPTCVEMGYVWQECEVCGAEKNLESGEPTGEHTYKTVKEIAPTCVEMGYVWQEWEVCGAEKNFESGEPTGEHSETYKDIFEANCSAEGYVKEICRACGEIVSEEILPKNDNHFFYNGKCMKCEAIEAVNTQATQNCDHANTYEEVFEATCSKVGFKKVICSDCEEVISEEELPMNDNHAFHNGVCLLCGESEETECNHVNTYEDIFEATCSKVGSKKVICSDCEEVISEEELPMNDNHAFHNGVCLLCGAEEEKECEHSYVTVKELAPTCVEAGYVWQECEVCGAEKNFEYGEPTGEHTYKTVKELAPTCAEAGYVWQECEVCGAEKNFEFGEPTGEHTYKTIVDMMPTCTEPGTQHDKCEVCGAETEQDLIPATGHQNVGLDYDADDHWIYCEDCDEVLVIEGHEFAYWSANGYKHAECKHCPYATSWKTQSGELDGLPKTGDR